MNQERDVDLYEIITRGGGIVLSALLWIVSMRFSVDGFKIASQDDAWVGWILGFMVTYLQIMFNRGAPNKTLYLSGAVAYVYGMATNLIGIIAIRGGDVSLDSITTNPLSWILQMVVVLTIAAAVEIIPEHLMIYCIRQDGGDGDFIDSLFRGLPKRNGQPRTGLKKQPLPDNRPAPGGDKKPKGNRPDNRPDRVDPNRSNRPLPGREPRNPRDIPVHGRGQQRPPITIRPEDRD